MKEKKKIKIVILLICILFFINTFLVIKNNVNADEKDDIFLHTVIGKENNDYSYIDGENNLTEKSYISEGTYFTEINENAKKNSNNIQNSKTVLSENADNRIIKSVDLNVNSNIEKEERIKESVINTEEKVEQNNMLDEEEKSENVEENHEAIKETIDDHLKEGEPNNNVSNINDNQDSNIICEDEISSGNEESGETNELIKNPDENEIIEEIDKQEEILESETDMYNQNGEIELLSDSENELNESSNDNMGESLADNENGQNQIDQIDNEIENGQNQIDQIDNEIENGENQVDQIDNENNMYDNQENIEEVEEVYYVTDENGKMTNISDKLHETKYADGLEISNIKLTCIGNISSITANVKNISDETIPATMLSIKMVNNKGNEIVTIKGYVSEMSPRQIRRLNASASYNFVNAYDMVIETIK